jgi:WD domain, G-beta repeat/WD40-like Beta Propeller Repeat
VQTLKLPQYRFFTDVAFAPDGDTIGVSDLDGRIYLWDLPSTRLKRMLRQPSRDLYGGAELAFSPSGRLLASRGADGKVVFWDIASGEQSGRPVQAPGFAVGGALAGGPTFSPDGRRLAVATQESILVWDVQRRTAVRSLKDVRLKPVATAAAISPDSRLLAVAMGDISLHNLTTGKRLGAPLARRDDYIYSLAFSHDGAVLAAGVAEGGVLLWSVPNRQLLAQLEEGVLATHVAFSPREVKLATIEGKVGEEVATLWDLTSAALHDEACTAANRNLTRSEWNTFIAAFKSFAPSCATRESK